MIIVKISGGVGNQFFQYAFAKSLEKRRGLEVKIDTSCYKIKTKTITPRKYALDNFSISLKTADHNDFHKIGVPYPADKSVGENCYRLMSKISEFFRSRNDKRIIICHDLDYNPLMLGIHDNCYVSGSWTNEKFFIDIREVILDELHLKNQMSERACNLAEEISNRNAVSVHIRRGDYLRYGHKFNLLGDDYYKKAVNEIEKCVSNPTFFIFSDDIDFVKKEYHQIFEPGAKYVSENQLEDYEELMLMSYCKHNIIANSTFSWWGAWLNKDKEKCVIAPKQYRSDGKNMSDVYPKSWLLI